MSGKQPTIYAVLREIWLALTGGLLIFILMELIKPRSVLAWLNLNFYLVLWLISAILLVVFSNRQKKN